MRAYAHDRAYGGVEQMIELVMRHKRMFSLKEYLEFRVGTSARQPTYRENRNIRTRKYFITTLPANFAPCLYQPCGGQHGVGEFSMVDGKDRMLCRSSSLVAKYRRDSNLFTSIMPTRPAIRCPQRVACDVSRTTLPNIDQRSSTSSASILESIFTSTRLARPGRPRYLYLIELCEYLDI